MTHSQQQLALNLLQPLQPSFASYVEGRNAEAVAALQALAGGTGERFVYLWGSPGSGRSHLLRALAAELPHQYCAAPEPPTRFDPAVRLYLVDDVERLDEDGQHRLFILLNEARAGGAAAVTTGSLPPVQLPLRDDVRTRLGWGLVYQLHGLTDLEKAEALRARASERGLELGRDVVDHLLTHMPRDMRTLMAVLDALDNYAMAAKRAVTVPLIREWAQAAR